MNDRRRRADARATPQRALTRRGALLAASALVALGLGACGGDGGGEETAEVDTEGRADNVLGSPDAPVTIIEYASVTCPHCKAFHDQVWAELKARYIDTGKVRFVFRELPTAPSAVAMAGFLMARCAPEDKYFDVLDVLFERQVDLVRAYQEGGGAAREEFMRIARPLGISEEQFDACVRNPDEIARIEAIGQEGYDRYGVTGTPTFVIDGRSYPAMTIDEFAAIIDPMIEGDDASAG